MSFDMTETTAIFTVSNMFTYICKIYLDLISNLKLLTTHVPTVNGDKMHQI